MPDKNKLLDIVKSAVLLEHKGKALYQSVEQTTKIEGVKELFRLLAEEESKHIDILKNQYRLIIQGKELDISECETISFETSKYVLSPEVIKNIHGAGFEAAVISAALDFEKKAVDFYSQNAAQSSSSAEKKLFSWLADWEKTHMEFLSKIDEDIREQIWYDNRFWPF
ncbi:MAG: ferritin family protein [Candidatus Aminicenantes bacterium]|nr:ferritin family protein [Candidatus Aminicenantes bacterium]